MNYVTLPLARQVSEAQTLTRITGLRLAAAKPAFVTRNIPLQEYRYLATGDVKPMPGDLLLARVDRLGQHRRLERPDGRRAHLFIGDEIIVCYGDRYAPDQFHAQVPKSLEPCSLVAAGGIAAQVVAKHSGVKNATRITPLGLFVSHQRRLMNLYDWKLPDTPATMASKPLVLAVVGSSMNGGKTTTAAHLIRGLVRGGFRVAAAKVTGTGAGLDYWKFCDAGAFPVVDFTDMGLPSTYRCAPRTVEGVMDRQVRYLANYGADVVVLEVADGLMQPETAALLEGRTFGKTVDGLFFAAAEAMSVPLAVEWLEARNLPLIGISGALTASPLAAEEAGRLCGVPVFTREDLGAAQIYDTVQSLLSSRSRNASGHP